MISQRQRRLNRKCPNLSEALQRYLEEISPHKKSGYQEKSIARAWKNTNIINRSLARITAYDLRRLRDEWLKTRKPATVISRLALISHLYTITRKEWGLDWLANPVELVSRPAVDDARERRIYTKIRLYGVPKDECPRSEFDWIIKHTHSKFLPIIALLAKETTMRRSEIVYLERERIDLTNNVITLTDTKNGDTRYVPISPFAKEALREYLAGKPLRGRIFDITPGAITRAWSRARERARKAYVALCKKYNRRPVAIYFDDLRFHDLRHEATSQLADVYPAHKLSKVTGHRSTKMLLRYYHPRGRDLARELWSSKLGRWQRQQIKLAA